MPYPSKPRTNSLAFAKTDCHTCTANRSRCDRKRPRCSSCSGKNIICGGYPMQLKWPKSKPLQTKEDTFREQEVSPFYIEPMSLQASAIMRNSRSRRCRPSKPRCFKFIVEDVSSQKQSFLEANEARSRQESSYTNRNQTQVPIQQSNSAFEGSTNRVNPNSSVPGRPGGENHDDKVTSSTLYHEQHTVSDPFSIISPVSYSFDALDAWDWSPFGTMDIEDSNETSIEGNGFDTMAVSSISVEIPEQCSAISPTAEVSWQDLIVLESSILHKDLFKKFEPLLDKYDRDFCIVPLSGDGPNNPFRCRAVTSRKSQSLLHAIIAVSSYHAGRQVSGDDYSRVDIASHQETAVRLHRTELDNCTASQGLMLLDTTMVLFLFMATQSAFNNWATHISDAGKLLNLTGGPRSIINNRRVQAQVVMLLWWDATIALLSRQECLLSYSYFEALVDLEDDRHWTFFDLIGCPREFVIPLMQLTSLAEEYEKTLSMRWARFDLAIVDDIEASVSKWKNSGLEIDNDLPEEAMQQQRDRWHCTEAWRYGLLIYITRVFRWDRKCIPPNILRTHARLIVEHVHCCRRTSIVQKQAFLPLFFAGCETKDRYSRQSIRDYCQHWDTVSGYNLFSTASSLLEDLWMDQERPGGEGVWWGSIIDEKQRSSQPHGVSMQFCFG